MRVRRFRAERQILAPLEHPNIARLLDGGATDDGLAVLRHGVRRGPADRPATASARPRPLRDRLALFLDVCDAVSYAHRKLVVHRDLKPANILVTADGVPKLLDFGIAKLLGRRRGRHQRRDADRACGVLTPDYAAPEQVRGEPVTTATDVYALGVRALRAAHRRAALHLHNATSREIERVVCDVEPPPAGAAVAPAATRDLDTIVLTALQKEPERR